MPRLDMKLTNINPQHVEHLTPSWAINPFTLAKILDEQLDAIYQQRPKLKPKRWDKRLRFWIEVTAVDDQWSIRVAEPATDYDRLSCGQLILTSSDRTVVLPLNAMFKGSDKLDGSHCVYVHTIMTETPLQYIGISKRRWFDRYAEHRNAAERGSNLVFHAALREHADKPVNHRVFLAGIGQELAFQHEEELVSEMTLYPKGLNMIPGGHAGIRYLHKLGVLARNAQERDEQLELLASRESIEGKPNPLCAARWAADQDFVNRVICGHSGRLTVGQVRQIRLLASFGRPHSDVATTTGASTRQVKQVIDGKVYGRIA